MANLSMNIGDYRQFQLAVTLAGQPANLTGIEALTFTLRSPIGSGGGVVAAWGLGSGVVVTNAGVGIAVLSVTPGMTSFAVPNTTYIYNWSLVDSLGNPTQAIDTGTFLLTLP